MIFIFTIFTYFLKFYNRYVWVHRLQVLLTRLCIGMNTYKCILSLQAVYLKCIKYCNLKHAGLLARKNSRRCCHCTSPQAALHAQCLVNAHKHGERQRPRTQTRGEGSVRWNDPSCSMKDQGRHLWYWQWCLNLDGEKNHSVIPIATILNLFRLYPSHSQLPDTYICVTPQRKPETDDVKMSPSRFQMSKAHTGIGNGYKQAPQHLAHNATGLPQRVESSELSYRYIQKVTQHKVRESRDAFHIWSLMSVTLKLGSFPTVSLYAWLPWTIPVYLPWALTKWRH